MIGHTTNHGLTCSANMSFPDHEQQRALNTLRYIHANPKTAAAFTTANA